MGFGPFVRLRQQDCDDPQHANEQQHADGDAGQCQILLRIFVDHPRGQCADGVNDDGEETSAAIAQRAAVQIEPEQERCREQHGNGGQHLPRGKPDNRLGEFEFGPALRVIDAPVGADTAFRLRLPRLVKGLFNVVRDMFLLCPGQKPAQKKCFVGIGCHRLFPCPAIGGPAHLADHHRLLREAGLDFLVFVDGVLNRLLDVDAFPVGQQVDRDVVHMVDEFRVLHPDVPGFGGADGLTDGGACPVEVIDELFQRDVVAQHRLVADDYPGDVAVRAGQFRRPCEFLFIVFGPCVDPDPQRDVQPPLLGKLRDEADRTGH